MPHEQKLSDIPSVRASRQITVTDAALIPDELCDVTVTMSAELWRSLAEHVYECSHTGEFDGRFYKIIPARAPSNERIRAALQKPCPRCEGTGNVRVNGATVEINICPDCHGTKTASVPGARLEPRGESVVVR